jgi:L-ascorbate metabolism protein UlaG (beta-lactamase superfamily)
MEKRANPCFYAVILAFPTETSLVTHGHLDHALDATYIAKKTGATIIGNETVANLARAYDVPDAQLIVVLGGRTMRLGRSP